MDSDRRPVRRCWSKADARDAQLMLAAERSDSVSTFVTQATSLDLTGRSGHSDDVFLLALAVTLNATTFRRRRTGSRESDFWDGLEGSDGEELVDVDLVRRIHRFVVDPLGHRARGGLIPGPPQTVADMYTVCVCCNFALDDAVLRSRFSSSWGLLLRTSAAGMRWRRVAIPGSSARRTQLAGRPARGSTAATAVHGRGGACSRVGG